MLIAIERLLVRVRQVPSRADELVTLRTRLRAARGGDPALATEIRSLKAAVSAAIGDVSACSTCAKGKHAPRGTFAGGDCCTGVTADLFSDDEVAALAAGGTRPRDLHAPRSEHAGCAFRGATGCTLGAEDRPERCVHYTCHLLRRELRDAGRLGAVDALLDTLRERMTEHTARYRAQLDDEIVADLEAALRAGMVRQRDGSVGSP